MSVGREGECYGVPTSPTGRTSVSDNEYSLEKVGARAEPTEEQRLLFGFPPHWSETSQPSPLAKIAFKEAEALL